MFLTIFFLIRGASGGVDAERSEQRPGDVGLGRGLHDGDVLCLRQSERRPRLRPAPA